MITEHFPEHMPELVIALGMGMRLTEQFQLKWESVDVKRKEVRLSAPSARSCRLEMSKTRNQAKARCG